MARLKGRGVRGPKYITWYKKNKVASIMDTSIRHKCYTVLFILPIHPQELEKEVRIRPVVMGVKGLRTEGDNSAFL
jgi:hypothetical protein